MPPEGCDDAKLIVYSPVPDELDVKSTSEDELLNALVQSAFTLPEQKDVYPDTFPEHDTLEHETAPEAVILEQLIEADGFISSAYFPTFAPDNWSVFVSVEPLYTSLAKEYALKSTVKLLFASNDRGDDDVVDTVNLGCYEDK